MERFPIIIVLERETEWFPASICMFLALWGTTGGSRPALGLMLLFKPIAPFLPLFLLTDTFELDAWD